MNCIVCKKPASFRFCSNQCFLKHAKSRSNTRCAICRYDPKTGRVGDERIGAICDECRAAPENERWQGLPDGVELDPYIQDREFTLTLAAALDERRPPMHLLEWARELSRVKIAERRPRRDSKGRRRGNWIHRRRPTAAEIAAVVGLSERQVQAALAC